MLLRPVESPIRRFIVASAAVNETDAGRVPNGRLSRGRVGDPNGCSPLDSVKQGSAPQRRKAGSSRPFRQFL
jgi:hypothetical protein